MELSIPIIASSISFLLIAVVVFSLIRASNREGAKLESRLSRFKEEKNSSKKSVESIILEEKARLGHARGGRLRRINNLETWLRHAGVTWLSVTNFAIISLCFNLGMAYMVYSFFATPPIIALVVGAVLTFLLSTIVINGLTNRRKNKFLEAFPDALDLIRRALKTGYTPDRAMAMAAVEASEPVKSAFREVVDRTAIGEPLDKALETLVNEIGVDEFRMLAIVLVLQRDTGGSLSEVIDNFSKIMRERLRLKKKIRAITAEGKASGYMVSAIPFVIIVVLQVLVPGYMDPLFHSSSGRITLMIGGGLMMVGLFTIYKMISKDYY